MTDKYTALLDKLKEAPGPFKLERTRSIVEPVYSDPNDERGILLWRALVSDLAAPGAALALVEMTLPGWQVSAHTSSQDAPYMSPKTPYAEVWEIYDPQRHAVSEEGTPIFSAFAPTLPLAILMAWCEAMIQKESSK